jgi:hypothetical protein
VIAIAGIIRHDGQFPGALLVQRIQQVIGNPDHAKSGHQYRRSVANPGHGIGYGFHLLVDHVKLLCHWLRW